MIAWRNICKPKAEGGLGLKEIRNLNQALIGKQIWHIYTRRDAIISQDFWSKYRSSIVPYDLKCPQDALSIWKGIFTTLENIQAGLEWEVGKGINIKINSKLWFSLATQDMQT